MSSAAEKISASPPAPSRPAAEEKNTQTWPAEHLERVPSCPVCRTTDRHIVHSGLRDRAFRCAPGEWNIYSCNNCGAGFLDPRPTAESIGQAYATYFTHAPTPRSTPPSSAWRRFRAAQLNGYLNARFGYELSPASRFTATWISRRRREHYDRCGAFLSFPGKGARLLDVGCGNGSFLTYMRALGWEVAGVEPDPKSAAEACAAGLAVRTGSLESTSFPSATFDAVTLHHVIEHLHNPIRTLLDCRRLLKPGGAIVIVTPNFGSIGHQMFGIDWFALEVPRHLVLFTLSSLRAALQKAGFETQPPAGAPPSPRFMFERSFQLRHGGDPISRTPALPWLTQLNLTWMAWKADRRARLHYELADELTVVGRRIS